MLIHPGQLKPIANALGLDRAHRLLPVVVPRAASEDYAILNRDAAGDPITYDPCKPVRYVVNPSGAPPDYMAFIEPAILKAQAATGLKFVYDGTSTDTWSAHVHAQESGPVLLSFPTSLEVSTEQADAVGVGGSAFRTVNGLRQPHYLTGQIALLRGWFQTKSDRRATSAEQSVVMHELGHVIGLGHVQDPRQVMYPTSHGQIDYGVGDLAGFSKLGAGPCD